MVWTTRNFRFVTLEKKDEDKFGPYGCNNMGNRPICPLHAVHRLENSYGTKIDVIGRLLFIESLGFETEKSSKGLG